MTGHEFLAEAAAPTAEIRFWLRCCNGAGAELVGYDVAAWCAAQTTAIGTLDTGLSWTAASTQDPTVPEREFTLAPLTDNQAAAWIRANGGARRTST